MPAIARRIADIDLTGEWSTTFAGGEFVLHQDERTVMFATEENLRVSLVGIRVFWFFTYYICAQY